MAVLDVRNLTMSFADKKLYEDASFQLEKRAYGDRWSKRGRQVNFD